MISKRCALVLIWRIVQHRLSEALHATNARSHVDHLPLAIVVGVAESLALVASLDTVLDIAVLYLNQAKR